MLKDRRSSGPASDANALPIHAKDVKPIDIAALNALKTLPTDQGLWAQTSHWVFARENTYDQVSFSGKLERSRLSWADENTLVRLGLIRVLDERDAPLGTVKLFWVAEWAKRRRRPIRWTKDVNDILGRETLAGVKMPSRAEQLQQALTGCWSICLDMSAWFDQIPLSEEVQRQHCFIGRDGRIYCLTRLPMGQRQAVDVPI